MPIEISIINVVVIIAGAVTGGALALIEIIRANQYQKWQDVYGNTDFENPYKK